MARIPGCLFTDTASRYLDDEQLYRLTRADGTEIGPVTINGVSESGFVIFNEPTAPIVHERVCAKRLRPVVGDFEGKTFDAVITDCVGLYYIGHFESLSFAVTLDVAECPELGYGVKVFLPFESVGRLCDLVGADMDSGAFVHKELEWQRVKVSVSEDGMITGIWSVDGALHVAPVGKGH